MTKTLNQLTEITALADDDLLLARDVSAVEDFKITLANLREATGVNKRTIYVGSVAELATISGLTANQSISVASRLSGGKTGGGVFVWRTGDQSSRVSADTAQVIWVAPDSDPTGASGAWMRRYSSFNGINIYWAGALPGAGNDNTSAVQASHDALPNSGGRIFVPAAIDGEFSGDAFKFLCDGELLFTKPITISGEGRDSSVLAYTGDSGNLTTPFIEQTSTYGLTFEDVGIAGSAGPSGEYFISGSLGVVSAGNIETFGAKFSRFQRAIGRSAGFYNKFTTTHFERCAQAVYGLSANNLTFVSCRFAIGDSFVLHDGGAGPVSFIGCSLERVTTEVVNSTTGLRSAVAFLGCYIENYPNDTGLLALGLAKDNYRSAKVAVFSKSISFTGNTLQTGGFDRVFNNSGVALDSLVSKGNSIFVSNTAPGDTMDFFLVASDLKSGDINDIWEGTPPVGFQHISATFSNPEAVKIVDPVTGESSGPVTSYVLPALLNSWTQDAGGQEFKYVVRNSVLHISGSVDGSGASSNVFYTLPADIVSRLDISSSYWFPIFNWSTGTVSAGRVQPTGSIRSEVLANDLSFEINIPLT